MLFLQALGDAKDAAEIADILAEGQYIRIAAHHHVQGGVEGLDHGHAAHGQTPSSARCSRVRQSGLSNTPSNISDTGGLDWPSVPTASPSLIATLTASASSASNWT